MQRYVRRLHPRVLTAVAWVAVVCGSACTPADQSTGAAPRPAAGAAGAWRLQQVAGVLLPAVVDSATVQVNGQAQVTRFRIDSATVLVHADGQWERQLFMSGWRVDAGATQPVAVFTSSQQDHGIWSGQGDVLAFTSAVQPEPIPAVLESEAALTIGSWTSAVDGAVDLRFVRR